MDMVTDKKPEGIVEINLKLRKLEELLKDRLSVMAVITEMLGKNLRYSSGFSRSFFSETLRFI